MKSKRMLWLLRSDTFYRFFFLAISIIVVSSVYLKINEKETSVVLNVYREYPSRVVVKLTRKKGGFSIEKHKFEYAPRDRMLLFGGAFVLSNNSLIGAYVIKNQIILEKKGGDKKVVYTHLNPNPKKNIDELLRVCSFSPSDDKLLFFIERRVSDDLGGWGVPNMLYPEESGEGGFFILDIYTKKVKKISMNDAVTCWIDNKRIMTQTSYYPTTLSEKNTYNVRDVYSNEITDIFDYDPNGIAVFNYDSLSDSVIIRSHENDNYIVGVLGKESLEYKMLFASRVPVNNPKKSMTDDRILYSFSTDIKGMQPTQFKNNIYINNELIGSITGDMVEDMAWLTESLIVYASSKSIYVYDITARKLTLNERILIE